MGRRKRGRKIRSALRRARREERLQVFLESLKRLESSLEKQERLLAQQRVLQEIRQSDLPEPVKRAILLMADPLTEMIDRVDGFFKNVPIKQHGSDPTVLRPAPRETKFRHQSSGSVRGSGFGRPVRSFRRF